MDLKENLQHFRKRQGLSQIELAEALAVSRQTISKWETGAALPSAENLAALGQRWTSCSTAEGQSPSLSRRSGPRPSPRRRPPPPPGGLFWVWWERCSSLTC